MTFRSLLELHPLSCVSHIVQSDDTACIAKNKLKVIYKVNPTVVRDFTLNGIARSNAVNIHFDPFNRFYSALQCAMYIVLVQ